jgi:hypothetical protein
MHRKLRDKKFVTEEDPKHGSPLPRDREFFHGNTLTTYAASFLGTLRRLGAQGYIAA